MTPGSARVGRGRLLETASVKGWEVTSYMKKLGWLNHGGGGEGVRGVQPMSELFEIFLAPSEL